MHHNNDWYLDEQYYPNVVNFKEKQLYLKYLLSMNAVYVPFNALPSTIMVSDLEPEVSPIMNSRSSAVILRYPDMTTPVPFPAYTTEGRVTLRKMMEYGIYGVDVWIGPNVEYTTYSDLDISYRLWDYEFIYAAPNFDNMLGHEWESFRKNSRKWLNRVEERNEVKWSIGRPNHNATKLLEQFFAQWASNKEYESVQGIDVLYDKVMYGFTRPWTQYLTMFYKDSPMAVVVGEQYGAYVYFTACITLPGENFLEEYARLQFMKHCGNVLVNDGGSLGEEGLYRFKQKMNPERVKEVLTYEWNERSHDDGNID